MQFPMTAQNSLKVFFLLAVLALLHPSASHGQTDASLTRGLVGHYRFNGNLDDQMGNGRDGRITGARFVADRFGAEQSAISFPRAGDGATSRNLMLPLGGTPRSLSLWVRIASFDSGVDSMFLSYGTQAVDQFCGLLVERQLRTLMFAAWWESVGVSGSAPLSLGTWHQVTFTYDGQQGFLYADGRFVVGNPVPLQTTSDMTLHFGYTDATRYLLGDLDDVRIYNRALSGNEVKALYDLERLPPGTQVPSPRRATGTAVVNSGFLTGIIVTDPGAGYTATPEVRITGDGSGAKALALMTNGTVASVVILASGSGYSQPPGIIFDPPITTSSLSIETSAVRLTLHAVAGQKYQFETSAGDGVWQAAGEPFTAQADEVSATFQITTPRQLFRVREIP